MEKIQELAVPRLLSELVVENRVLIGAIQATVGEWVRIGPGHIRLAAKMVSFDEIFILRFVLSNQGESVAEIIRKVQETLEWRGEHLGLLSQVAEGSCEMLRPANEYFCRAYVGDYGGHCFFMERNGHHDFPRLQQLLKFYSSEDSAISFSDAILLSNEVFFRKTDSLSRRINRLSTAISLHFLDNVSMIPTPSVMKAVHATGLASKKSSIYYPQLVGAGVLFSSQSLVIRFVLKISKTVISEKAMSKVVVCPGFRKDVPPSACPALRRLDPTLDWTQVFPTCANGTAKMPASLRSKMYDEEE